MKEAGKIFKEASSVLGSMALETVLREAEEGHYLYAEDWLNRAFKSDPSLRWDPKNARIILRIRTLM